MKNKTRKYIIVIAVTVILITLVMCVVGYNLSRFKLSISDSIITKETYLQIMNKNVPEVTKYFKEKGVSNSGRDFWVTSIDGEIPYKVLTDKTLDELKYIAAVYEIAQEKKYIEKDALKTLSERIEQENKTRKESIEKGEPVYGLAEFSADTFLEYEMDTLQKMYCDDIENDGMEITDTQREKYYNENKDRLFNKNDDISISYIKIDYEQQGSDEKYQLYKDMLNQMYKSCIGGSHIQDLIKDYPQINSYFKHLDLKSAEIGAYTRSIPDILEYSYDLKPNETTTVIDENGCLYLIECTDRVYYDYHTIDTVRENIDKILREENYEKILQERADKLVVNANLENIYKFTKRNI